MGAQKGSLMPVDEFLQLGMKHRANWFELEMLQDKEGQAMVGPAWHRPEIYTRPSGALPYSTVPSPGGLP